MNDKTLLRNGLLIGLEPLKIEARDLLIVDGRVAAKDERINVGRDMRVIDCRGRYVLPGFVNAHSRLHASQARLFPAPVEADPVEDGFRARRHREHGFVADALSPETIVTSVFAGTLDAVRFGTTTIIDHHSSPNCIAGSLDLVRDTILTVGPRAVLSYEVGDTGAPEAIAAGLEENRRFARENRSDRVVGVFGAESIAALDDAALAGLASVARSAGFKAVLDEDPTDPARSLERFGKSSLARLEALGMVGPKSIFAHGTHASPSDLARLRELGAWIVHCPNAAARMGLAPLAFENLGDGVALGTGAGSSDLFAEARAAWNGARSRGARIRPEDIVRMLVSGQQLASELLGLELGSTRRDAGADFVILDYHPRTALNDDSLAAHLVFGMTAGDVREVIVDGEVVYRNGNYPHIDMQHLSPLVRRGADALCDALAAQHA